MSARSVRRRIAALCIASATALVPRFAGAVSTSWTFSASGNWNVTSNWSSGVPTTGTDIFITHNDANNRTITFNFDYPTLPASLIMDQTGSGQSTLTMSANRFGTTGSQTIGQSGKSIFSQSGGTNSVGGGLILGANPTGNGTYLLSGGTVSATFVQVGSFGTANFIQSGGTISALGGDFAGVGLGIARGNNSVGSYTLGSGGTLAVAGNEAIGHTGNGTFTQNGGKHTVGLGLYAGLTNNLAVGSILLNGGSLSVTGDTYVGFQGNGQLFQSGGSATFNGAVHVGDVSGSAGTLALGGTGSASFVNGMIVGEAGLGTFTQSGTSTATFSQNEVIGLDSTGTFNMTGGTQNIPSSGVNPTGLLFGFNPSGRGIGTFSGGTLNVAYTEYVGYFGRGTFTQSGGVNQCQYLGAGWQPGSFGTFTISGGSLTSLQLWCGYEGDGTVLIQSTAMVNTAGLVLGFDPNAHGFVSMNNGSLTSTFDDNIGLRGLGTFMYSGGGHQGGSMFLGYGTLTSAGTCLFSGGTTSLSGDISDGRLGTGFFRLSGGSLSVGGLISIGSDLGGKGTFVLQGNGSMSASSIVVTPNGTLQLSGGTINSGEIIQSGTLICTASSSPRIDRLTTNFGSSNTIQGSLSVGGTLADVQGAPILGGGTISILATSQFNGFGLVQPTVVNSGILSAVNGNMLLTSGTFNNSGLLYATPGAAMFINATNVTNTGSIQIGGGTIVFSAPLNIAAAKSIVMSGGLLSAPTITIASGGLFSGFGQLGGGVTNNGSMTFIGASQVAGAINNSATGRITARNDKVLVTFPSVNNGTITTTSGGTLIFDAGLTGSGVFNAQPLSALVTPFVRQDTLSLSGAVGQPALAIIRPSTFGGDTSVLSTLTISGTSNAWTGQIDVADTSLIVNYVGSSPIDTIANQITTGFAGGNWTGMGVTSSSAASIAASSNIHKTALGFAEASALGLSTFGGQSVDSSSVLVRYTLSGDANLDGAVNSLDFQRLGLNFNGLGKLWFGADFNYDGKTNALDFNAIATNFGSALSMPAARLSSPKSEVGTPMSVLVPEPASFVFAAVMVSARRRRA